MSTIVITTTGTLGDHLPYIELGKYLQQRGHRVRMAINQAMIALATRAGLETAPCGIRMGEQEARRGAEDWNHWTPCLTPTQTSRWQAYLKYEIPLSFNQLLEICADADLLICGYQRQTLGCLMGQKTGIAWVATSLMPAMHCMTTTNPLIQDAEKTPRDLAQTYHEIAQELGVQAMWEIPQNRAILAASSHFSQPNAANAFYQQTGFWFYEDSQWQTWQADEALQNFLTRFPNPLTLSFSSLPLQDAQSVLALHVRAAAKLGRGLLVQRGWANFSTALLPADCDPKMVFFSDFISHDWLFSRVAAVIHHGGIGTLARALRHGCPMLVEPYGNDQFFNAKQVLIHQIGAAAHPQKVTVEGLVRLLEQKVLTEQCRHNAQQLGEKIRAENGLEKACQLIESYIHER